METVEFLQGKRQLNASDAAALLQLIQEQAAPILSLRAPPAPSSSSSLAAPPDAKHRHSAAASCRGRAALAAGPERGRSHGACSSSTGSKRTQLDVNSLEQFPPMNTTSGVASSRKKRSGKSSKPVRRITLTPVESQSSAVAHFSASPAANAWASNPAFTRSSYNSPVERTSSLTEERKLLQQEREKSKRKSKSQSRLSRSKEQADSFSSISGSARSGRQSSSISGLSSCRETAGSFGDTLDARISGHSIFELSGQVRSSSHPTTTQASHHSKTAGHATPSIDLTSEPQANPSTSDLPSSSLPMTSTPLLRSDRPLLVSPDSVTNIASLDSLARLYATLINDRLVPNVTSEIHFVFQMLTVTVPPAATSSSKGTGAHDLFVSVENCVYFAVGVLSKIKHLLVALDRATLQLLSENVRITEFNPQLASFFTEACERKAEGLSPPLSSAPSISQDGRQGSSSVPFHEETDNSRNFPNSKAFHAFKKQRDAFYSALREWERERDNPSWNMEEMLSRRVPFVVKAPNDITSSSYAHFARLFQRQLVESCRGLVQAEGDVRTLARHLGKTDPQRLMKLNERFFLPPSTGHGPCPPPSFLPTEEFFTTLIKVADSYIFNQHLKLALWAELHKLHSSCSSLQQPSEAPDVVHTMRLLAKFLGFVEFLPHSSAAPEPVLAARDMVGSFDVHRCVLEARNSGYLALTVPWVVELLSMMDPQAIRLSRYSSLLDTLMSIYREVQLCDADGARNDSYLVVTCLGWLFENPNFASSLFFDNLKKSTRTVDPPTTELSPAAPQRVVSTKLLYSCCPYLGELRVVLSEFAAGLECRASPIRKIKPISVTVEEREGGGETRSVSQLQLQLQENFFRNHPPYLKQVCQITAERAVASALAQCEQRLTTEHVLVGLRTLAAWMREKWVETAAAANPDTLLEDIDPFSELEADRELALAVECTVQSLTVEAKTHCSQHCKALAARSLQALLAGSVADEVVGTASAIAGSWAMEKCRKWMAGRPHAIVHEQLLRHFEKMRKAVKFAKRKEQRNLRSPHMHFGGSLTASQLGERGGGRREAVLKALASEKELVQKFERFAKEEGNLLLLSEALVQLTRSVETGTSVTPGVHLPQLLPGGYDKTLAVSVQLAVELVAQAVFTTRIGLQGELLKGLLAFWKLAKTLKLELPVQLLMSATAFTHYCKPQGDLGKAVWQSLGRVLVATIESELTSSPLVEALWLCRKQQMEDQPRAVQLLSGASVFLAEWYSTEGCTAASCARGRDGPCSAIAGERGEACSGCGGVLRGAIVREAHFPRLLAAVFTELPQSELPAELMTPELSQVAKLVHPF